MHLKIIACEVFFRELSYLAAKSRNVVDLEFQPFGLHDTPKELRQQLQMKIDNAEAGNYDYIALGYALCSRGTVEVMARKKPLVIPKAHDCITLFLGSRRKYNDQFLNHPGTYYYTSGWIERCAGKFVSQSGVGESEIANIKSKFEEYKEKYGEENARYLIEQESGWLKYYSRAALLDLGFGDINYYRQFTKEIASSRGWKYEELKGDMRLLENLIAGNWNEDEFLIVPPGETIAESFDEQVLKTKPQMDIESQ